MVLLNYGNKGRGGVGNEGFFEEGAGFGSSQGLDVIDDFGYGWFD